MSPESLRRYISSLKIYARYLQERDLDILNVDRNVLRSFLEYLRNDRAVGLKTIGNYFTSMAMFYESWSLRNTWTRIRFIPSENAISAGTKITTMVRCASSYP